MAGRPFLTIQVGGVCPSGVCLCGACLSDNQCPGRVGLDGCSGGSPRGLPV